MKKIFLLLTLSFHLSLFAQDIQWASKVIEFSSEYMGTKFSAEQILGKPNVYPNGGSNAAAWSPKAADSKMDFIKVGFENPMQIQQIAIYETAKASAISAVYLYDESGKEYEIATFKAAINIRTPIIKEIKFPLTPYKVAAVKIVVEPKKVGGYCEIDAVGISNSQEKVEIKIDIAKDIVFEGEAEKLSEYINSVEYSEGYPIISPDGETMFFVRFNSPANVGGIDDANDIWISNLNSKGTWDVSYNIGRPLNTTSNNFVNSITPDGNTILLANQYNIDGTMTNGVSVANKTKTGWEFPTKQTIESYYNNNDYVAFYMSQSNKYLLMSIEQNDSKGDLDLCVSMRTGDNSWSAPINLGAIINTSKTDYSPYLAADDKTLYFTSDGHTGYGDGDIFVTKRLDDTWQNWSKPLNLGNKINTSGFDVGYTVTAKGDYAYFTSVRDNSKMDIYRIKLPQELAPDPVVLIEGKVFNKKTGEPIEAAIYYEYLNDGKEAGFARSNPATGEYKIVLPYGHNYGFRAEAKGFVGVNENLNLTEVKEYKEIKRDLYLVPIEVGQIVRLNNIFFDFGKSTLKAESFNELNRVAKMMTENPSMKLEIAGHTDNVGADEANQSLSQNRAASVVTYLNSKGISSDRLVAMGYGETSPVATNDTEEGRELNRRVEFKILSK
jgi:OmpA-OmpF porin, OOP family